MGVIEIDGYGVQASGKFKGRRRWGPTLKYKTREEYLDSIRNYRARVRASDLSRDEHIKVEQGLWERVKQWFESLWGAVCPRG